MQSIELIQKFLHERLGAAPDTVHHDSMLVDLGVDSLMLAELMFEAADSLDISLDSDIGIPLKVSDMVALLDSALAAKASKPVPAVAGQPLPNLQQAPTSPRVAQVSQTPEP